jgi:hypothetical protein
VTHPPSALPTRSSPDQPGSDSSAIAVARTLVAREPGLCAVGAGGIVIALLCLVGVAFEGRFVPPEGKLLDAATFTFGVGLFTLTIALLLPLAGYSPPARRRWRRGYYLFAVYGLVLEALQAFRGLDPRFTEVGDPIDEIAGAVFGVTAGITTVLFALLGLQFFRARVLWDRPVLRLGIRYGVAAVAISFGIGIVMSVNSGREIGDDGNLLLAHGLGVHGIQTLPLVALLVESAAAVARPRPWVHIAGVGWLTASCAALVQAALGRPPLEPSTLTVSIVIGLIAWAIVAAYALVSWSRTASWRPA